MAQNASISWRPLSSVDREPLARLYNEAFGLSAASGKNYLDDFPCWDPARTVHERLQLGGFSGDRLVASVSARAVTVLPPSNPLMALVGGVVVSEANRGLGHATEGMHLLIGECERRGLKHFALWGSEKNLYGRFGFKDAGVQKRASLAQLNLGLASSGLFNLASIRTGWNPIVQEWITRYREDGIKADDPELTLVSFSRNIQWMRLETPQGRAYVGVGKGIDLPAMIHTWGGDVPVLRDLLILLRDQISEELQFLWHPAHEKRFGFLAQAHGFEREHLMMLRSPTLTGDELWFWGTDSA